MTTKSVVSGMAILLMAATLASAQRKVTYEATIISSTIQGERYSTKLVPDTFAGQPLYDPAANSAPPLDTASAYRLAYDHSRDICEPGINYEVMDISLQRFHSSDWWYYVVEFSASDDWKAVEPYRSLLQNKKPDVALPCIHVVVLMTGDVILPQPGAADFRRPDPLPSGR